MFGFIKTDYFLTIKMKQTQKEHVESMGVYRELIITTTIQLYKSDVSPDIISIIIKRIKWPIKHECINFDDTEPWICDECLNICCERNQ